MEQPHKFPVGRLGSRLALVLSSLLAFSFTPCVAAAAGARAVVHKPHYLVNLFATASNGYSIAAFGGRRGEATVLA